MKFNNFLLFISIFIYFSRSIYFILNAVVLQPINGEETAWRVKRLSGASFGREFITEEQHRIFLFYAFNKVKWIENNPEVLDFFEPPQESTTTETSSTTTSLTTLSTVTQSTSTLR